MAHRAKDHLLPYALQRKVYKDSAVLSFVNMPNMVAWVETFSCDLTIEGERLFLTILDSSIRHGLQLPPPSPPPEWGDVSFIPETPAIREGLMALRRIRGGAR